MVLEIFRRQPFLGLHQLHERIINSILLLDLFLQQEPSQWVSLEIDFSGLRGGAILALAVDQVYSGGPEFGPETRIRRGENFCRCRNISAARQNNTWEYFLIQIFSG